MIRAARLFGILVVLTSLAGCHAQRSDEARVPARWTTPGYSWPPRSLDVAVSKSEWAASSAQLAKEGAPDEEKPLIPPSATPAPTRAPRMSAEACLKDLDERGVRYRALDELLGVEAPVVIEGPIGPVTFWVNGGGPLRMDCRLAIALHELGSTLEAHGVTRARFSGAYVYRTTRGGRLSHHAHGLALDVHEVLMNGAKLDVSADFARNVGCEGDIPALNRLACALQSSRLFEEFLTPDSNADHHDHLHLAVPRR